MKKISINDVCMPKERMYLPPPKVHTARGKTICSWDGIGHIVWDRRLSKEDATLLTWLWVIKGVREVWIGDKDDLSDPVQVAQIAGGIFMPEGEFLWN